jgi:hypothetical protein
VTLQIRITSLTQNHKTISSRTTSTHYPMKATLSLKNNQKPNMTLHHLLLKIHQNQINILKK